MGRHKIVEENWDEIASFHRELFDKVVRKLFVLISIILELPENYLVDAHAYDEESDDHLRYMLYNVRTQEEWDIAQAYSVRTIKFRVIISASISVIYFFIPCRV